MRPSSDTGLNLLQSVGNMTVAQLKSNRFIVVLVGLHNLNCKVQRSLSTNRSQVGATQPLRVVDVGSNGQGSISRNLLFDQGSLVISIF